MKYIQLGRTGLHVSRLCLGTMNFGTYADEKESFAIMDAALDAGINFFDTANAYPGGGKRGQTEEIIGRWFAQGGGRRERVVLATKVYGSMEDHFDDYGGLNLSRVRIRQHLHGSLKRLQTDYIDLYQMHHIDRTTTWEELWEVFSNIVQRGEVEYIGSSNFAGWHLVAAQNAAAKRNFLGLASEQHKYNLFCRLPELEVLPAAEALGIGVIPWSPLAGGLLGGNALNAKKGSRSAASVTIEERRPQLEAFASLCREIGENDANVALAWLLHNSAVTAPIIGPRTLEQLESSLRVPEIALDTEAMAKLDDIFPGPGGPAPEAYAW